jgi:hypothetical protein
VAFCNKQATNYKVLLQLGRAAHTHKEKRA